MTRQLGFVILVTAALTGLGGCGMNGSSSKSDSNPFGNGSVPPPDLSTANPPYSNASSNDLSLWYCHVHQDYYSDPTHFAFWWSVHSTFATDVANVEWMVRRLDGPAQPAATGVITNVKAGAAGGDGHDYHVEWAETAPGGRHYYQLILDPDNKISEAGKANNSYVFVVDVPGTSTPAKNGDLEFYGREAHVHCMMPSDQFDVHFELRNSSDKPMVDVQWRLQCPDIAFDQTFTIPKIDAQTVDNDISLQQILKISAPGLHDITLTIDPGNTISETNEANNVRVFHVLVGPPAGSG